MILIGFSGFRQRFKSSGPSLPVSEYGASAFGRPRRGRFAYARSRSWRLLKRINSVMVMGPLGGFVPRFDARLVVCLLDFLFAIGLTQRTDQIAVI
jgi:hypothetical protein